MTQVNWERYSGEQVEEFVAAMLLLRNPHGNLITPSQGDRGIDIQIKVETGGYDIYQVKKYASALSPSQKKAIEHSWKTFLAQTAGRIQVNSWNLALPYDPTPENLDWFEKLTGDSGITTQWYGRTQLDTLAADSPQLVDYYFGDGRQRSEQLLLDLISIQDNPASPSQDIDSPLLETLRNSLLAKATKITNMLDEVDPFYRYECEIRIGGIEELSKEYLPHSQRQQSEAFIAFLQRKDSNITTVLHVIPKCAESCRLKPITFGISVRAESGTEAHSVLQDFIQYGIPPQNIQAEIKDVQSPPGGPLPGKGIISLIDYSEQDKLPPLEIKFSPNESDGEVFAVDVEHISHGVAPSGEGSYLRFSDRSSVATITLLATAANELADLRVECNTFDGKKPSEVLPGLRLIAGLRNGGELELVVRDGGPQIFKARSDGSDNHELRAAARKIVAYIESLMEVQKHTFLPVMIPTMETVSDYDIDSIIQIARLLRGETITRKWSQLELTVEDREHIPFDENAQQAILYHTKLIAQVGDQEIDTGYVKQTEYKSARIASVREKDKTTTAGYVTLVPGSIPEAVLSAIPMSQFEDVPE
jgi:hypothetical protein